MGWEKTISTSDLPDGGRKIVTVSGKPILLINHCSKVYAISSTCPHWGLPLELGRLTDDCGIICPWHRSGFDLDTGDVKAWAPWPPGLGLVLGATSRKKVLPTYSTRIENGEIWVTLDADAAPTQAATSKAAPAAEVPAAAPAKSTPVIIPTPAPAPSTPPTETSAPTAAPAAPADNKPASPASEADKPSSGAAPAAPETSS